MTEALYYQDPHKAEFDAEVLTTEPTDAGVWVELDRTCFYPEGGGQPADRGWIDGIPVRDVKKRDGRVLHLLEREPPGPTVHGTLDSDMRRDYMQQHTGQHLVSAAMIEVGGYETVSVHQGEDYTTVEFAAPDIPAADLERAEALANGLVGENRPVTAFHVDSSEVEGLGLRRPPKFEGTLRIVEVEGIDRVACGGVHCRRTGEVGIIKLVGTEKIRGNVRTIWKIGDRALADYRLKTEVCNTLVDTFSAKIPELPDRAAKQEENLKQAEWEIGRLQKRLASEIAGRLAEAAGARTSAGGEAAGTPGGTGTPGATGNAAAPTVIVHHFDGEAKELFRAVAEDLATRQRTAALLTNTADGRVQWIIVATEDLELDFDRVRQELLPLIAGKGGGKPPIWQGVGTRPEGREDFAAALPSLFDG